MIDAHSPISHRVVELVSRHPNNIPIPFHPRGRSPISVISLPDLDPYDQGDSIKPRELFTL
jgi:hypothetical protein